ncbi:MAG: N-acetyl-gamma-glutamyl-phosphate reductase [Desulfuromonadales bacterium]|nr:N-acetyl-gamma-glutamyl-phosphate reductase [Desulfuromonadales bacterium]
MLKVAVVGASGYTGVELIRILHNHPEASVTAVTSEQSAGKSISELFPSLKGRCDLTLENLDPDKISEKADIIFTALPHKAAMGVVPAFLSAGKKVIDLSADYRLKNASEYEKLYQQPHLSSNLLDKAVYGLPELKRDKVAVADLVANPGCYPTSIILALAPLLKEKLVNISTIIADSKSGVSGAGRSLKVDNLYCEINEGFKAYGVGGTHRHIGEIEQELSLLAEKDIKISFTPHLVPMNRGILSTIYLESTVALESGRLLDMYEEFYSEEPFVRVLAKGEFPSTAFVRGSNFCDIAVTIDKRTGRIILVSAIDNLVKGASGQAVQNMNIISGFPENMGLEMLPVYP